MRRSRAFSLVEVLVTLALVSTIFILVLSMLQDALRTARQNQERDAAMNAVQVGLDRMTCEAREAIQISAPGVGATHTELNFDKVDPTSTTRLPPRTPSPSPSPSWAPFDDSWMLTVRYRVVGGELVREVGPRGGGATHRMAVAENVESLSVECWAQGRLTISLSVRQADQISTYTSVVNCPCVE